eukprot:2766625-Pyramimonas_sp.AAC.1
MEKAADQDRSHHPTCHQLAALGHAWPGQSPDMWPRRNVQLLLTSTASPQIQLTSLDLETDWACNG